MRRRARPSPARATGPVAWIQAVAVAAALAATGPVSRAGDPPAASAAPAASATGIAAADLPPRKVRAAVYADAPFAVRDSSGRWDGFSVVMLEAASVQSRLLLEFHECGSLDELYAEVASGQADVGVGNTLVTSARIGSVDYTQPTLDGGLRVMVPSDHSHTLSRLWEGLQSDGHVRVMLWGGAITLAVSMLLVFVLRRLDREFTPHWHEGLAESFYHVASVTMTGKTSYKGKVGPKWASSLVAALWLVFGVASVAYLTSSITSVMTANTMKSRIGGPHDLKDRTVGVLKGSVGERYCGQHGIDVVPFESIDAAAQALAAKELDAVVSDAQTIEYFDTSHPEVAVAAIGELFERRHFAFPVHQGDAELLGRLNAAIVSLREDGVLDRVRSRWFGH